MSRAAFTERQVARLQRSLLHWTGRALYDPVLGDAEAVAWLDTVPFGLVSHGTGPDPVFNYANRAALSLFGMSWDAFTAMPSRLSAAPVEQEERARLLDRVSRDGYIDDYAGIRVAADGRRFRIEQATVWNLLDEDGRPCGQAAMIPRWQACG